ncbi:imelysin family protein [Vibrio hannami]|nr:imelysin family protein [Vibrio hannami]MDG3088219.1 imelysin family protein [Vibrio hannami]
MSSSFAADTSGSHLSQGVFKVQKSSAEKFANATVRLEYDFQSFCKNDLSLEDLKQSWQSATHSWMYLQGQERGPDAALEKSWSIQFWPDKKNTTGRKMSQLVSRSEDISKELIAKESVTVQGIGAVEWLLYDSGSPIVSNIEKACELGVSITQNLSHNASVIENAWQENPWMELTEQQWHSEYLALLSNQLDYSMKKLSRPMAKLGKPKPYFSESWRSQISMANLKFNIDSLEAAYYAKGHGLDSILRAKGHPSIADRIQNQFATMQATWPEQASLFSMLKTKEDYREVLAQYNKLDYLNYLIHEEAAIALGVVVGFNATDGD